jgi:DNA-binding NarL/FixJ family response regulator
MTRVFIVEDHPIVRQGYALLIQREPDMELCGEASSGRQAIAQIALLAPDLVVVDISLEEDMDGVELAKTLLATHTNLPILMVSGHDEAVYAERLLAIGARGYVMKGDALAFLRALRQVAQGRTFASSEGTVVH